MTRALARLIEAPRVQGALIALILANALILGLGAVIGIIAVIHYVASVIAVLVSAMQREAS